MSVQRRPRPAAPGIGVAVLIVPLVWVVLFVQGWRSVPVDKVALHYTGGPIQG